MQYYRGSQRRPNGMANAALIMAGAAIFTVFTGVGPVFFGGLAILFAVLSRGGEKKLKGAALGSVIVSGCAIVAGIAMIVSVFIRIEYDPTVRAQVDQSFEMMYGVDYEGFKDGMQHYYETGEIPDFMKNSTLGNSPYTYPGGTQL
ncbi:MAG: hypothetical protein J6X66_03600 [Lachnospiraceae bacterium]|nr:hypothetical protein [Lachnospiraceae bacterium]